MAGEEIPANYVPILIFIGLTLFVGTVSLQIGKLFRPNRPYRAKVAPYESGSPLFQDARVQFPIRYYIIAMLFVIFDVEVVFLYPWAVAFKSLDLAGILGMGVFLFILIVGFWYEWKKGALEWD
ncbi:NADH-quinone oxidoreductase subunit A [Candidatus Nitrospira inopinata]|jgi:NADH-quinone oxidoreductase subunit A|uniref:NADH-quinone oxidoreductase subunit A n=1 Tax=Candidatus Nitrospira inopinata TaxID=1715989 RepID=A0A0S4KXJ5_9BACT|nr:NADH-quinone oxidoreductase subunit A [Candidatus Nitrospira inopinata]CUQ66354.1 NADH-quinone oxidoreductase subunit A [Candidatus Nitrospira inopinata]